MISCGEASGDLYAGALVRALRERDPGATVFGFGGSALASSGAELVGDYHGLSVTGLVEVLRLLPRTYAMYRRLVAEARARRPDVFVAVDFPDFNFRLGSALHAIGIPVVYYISPQLWAWRPGRLRTMQRFVDEVLVIFPFEEEIYRSAGIPVHFVGHPLVELVEPQPPREEFLAALGLAPAAPTVAVLPGSRPNELRLILPTMVEGAKRLATDVPGVQFVLARAPGLDAGLFEPFESACREGLRGVTVEQRTDAVLAASDVVMTASGTATVQAALHERPMVIVYRLEPLTYRLGIRFVRVTSYGMVNLVAGRPVAPELIQEGFTAEALARETRRLLQEPARVASTVESLRDVKRRLGGPGASGRAADRVLAVARGRASGLPGPV
jgi:lipid-A-disaccharide synthase